VAALTLATVAYVLHAALPASAFRLPFEKPQIVRALVPEGWAFFTRSPRAADPSAYGLRHGSWQLLTTGTQASPKYLMGLDRLGRSQGTELAILVQQVPAADWSDCRQAPVACLSGLPGNRAIANTSTHRTVCGDVGLVMQQVLPWAWRDLRTVMPSRVSRVRVAC
jgi:antimicrobial peptide system SdpA family protein